MSHNNYQWREMGWMPPLCILSLGDGLATTTGVHNNRTKSELKKDQVPQNPRTKRSSTVLIAVCLDTQGNFAGNWMGTRTTKDPNSPTLLIDLLRIVLWPMLERLRIIENQSVKNLKKRDHQSMWQKNNFWGDGTYVSWNMAWGDGTYVQDFDEVFLEIQRLSPRL